MVHATRVSNLRIAEALSAENSAVARLRRDHVKPCPDARVLMVDETASACSGNPEEIRSAEEIS